MPRRSRGRGEAEPGEAGRSEKRGRGVPPPPWKIPLSPTEGRGFGEAGAKGNRTERSLGGFPKPWRSRGRGKAEPTGTERSGKRRDPAS